MLIAGQRVDHAECLQVNARTIYYGQVKKNEAGKKIREGLGVQIVLSDSLDKDGQLVCRFEGEWKDDKMHGQGKLEMEEETYTGEFYEGLANGTFPLSRVWNLQIRKWRFLFRQLHRRRHERRGQLLHDERRVYRGNLQ